MAAGRRLPTSSHSFRPKARAGPASAQFPEEGNIKLAANELHHCFGVIPQKTAPVSSTHYNNLLMANPHASTKPPVCDAQTTENFAATINQLRGKVKMVFITNAMPKSLQVDEIVRIGGHGTKMAVVEEDKRE